LATLAERLTPAAERAIQFTTNEARKRRHAVITPENMLLAILWVKEGSGYAILRMLGVDITALTARVEQALDEEEVELAAGVGEVGLSKRMQAVVDYAVEEANQMRSKEVDTGHFLLGILQAGNIPAVQLLKAAGVELEQARAYLPPYLKAARGTNDTRRITGSQLSHYEPLTFWKVLRSISPVFWILVVITALAGYLVYTGIVNTSVVLFFFVVGGWVISLCLHEFGHALVAYLGGDTSVIDKGYLTLNPFLYTHVVFSIVLPLVFLLMGGIGLPGGAVYINIGAIRNRTVQSLVSLAGPAMTAFFLGLIAIPFFLGFADSGRQTHGAFWAGLAFLAFLQVTGLLFNLLPVPGLDGYGVLRPFLPEAIVRQLASLGGISLFLIFALFMIDNPLRDSFWTAVQGLLVILNIDPYLAFQGLDLFRFWQF
jgi:Zn-dependent protease